MGFQPKNIIYKLEHNLLQRYNCICFQFFLVFLAFTTTNHLNMDKDSVLFGDAM